MTAAILVFSYRLSVSAYKTVSDIFSAERTEFFNRMKNRSAPLAHPAIYKKQFFVFTSKNIAIGKLLTVSFLLFCEKNAK